MENNTNNFLSSEEREPHIDHILGFRTIHKLTLLRHTGHFSMEGYIKMIGTRSCKLYSNPQAALSIPSEF